MIVIIVNILYQFQTWHWLSCHRFLMHTQSISELFILQKDWLTNSPSGYMLQNGFIQQLNTSWNIEEPTYNPFKVHKPVLNWKTCQPFAFVYLCYSELLIIRWLLVVFELLHLFNYPSNEFCLTWIKLLGHLVLTLKRLKHGF